MQISSLQPAGLLQTLGKLPVPAQEGSQEGFGRLVQEQLAGVNRQQLQADEAIQQLAAGQTDNVHEVVLSMAQADLSFRLVLEIRNRLIESYQEIMRMQV